jgi:hypothetical protein
MIRTWRVGRCTVADLRFDGPATSVSTTAAFCSSARCTRGSLASRVWLGKERLNRLKPASSPQTARGFWRIPATGPPIAPTWMLPGDGLSRVRAGGLECRGLRVCWSMQVLIGHVWPTRTSPSARSQGRIEQVSSTRASKAGSRWTLSSTLLSLSAWLRVSNKRDATSLLGAAGAAPTCIVSKVCFVRTRMGALMTSGCPKLADDYASSSTWGHTVRGAADVVDERSHSHLRFRNLAKLVRPTTATASISVGDTGCPRTPVERHSQESRP